MGSTAPYRVVLAGVDTLRVNMAAELTESRTALLDALQAKAVAERDLRHGGRRDVHIVVTPWRLAGQPLLMAPHGGGKGQWRWLLHCPYARFNVGLGRLNGICAQVTLSSTFLWRFGYRQAWEKVERLLATWCTRAGALYQVSELHLCADVAGLALDELQVADFVHRGTVARWAQEDAAILDLVTHEVASQEGQLAGQERPLIDVRTRYREQETIMFSQTAPHSCAIYNKPREIRVKSRDKLWFADLWRRHGWDGEAPIARVEMRYERAVLHEVGCEGVTPTLAKLDSLWGYSTQQWLRHTTPQVAQRRRSLWPASPWWETVQSATFGAPQATPAQRRRVRQFQEERILATVLGYLESYAAWSASAPTISSELDLSTVLRTLAQHADAHYLRRGTTFYDQVLKKRRQLGFAG